MKFVITKIFVEVISFQVVIVAVNRTILETEICLIHYSAVPTETEAISYGRILGEVNRNLQILKNIDV